MGEGGNAVYIQDPSSVFLSFLSLDGFVDLYHTHWKVGREYFNEACILLMFMSFTGGC